MEPKGCFGKDGEVSHVFLTVQKNEQRDYEKAHLFKRYTILIYYSKDGKPETSISLCNRSRG